MSTNRTPTTNSKCKFLFIVLTPAVSLIILGIGLFTVLGWFAQHSTSINIHHSFLVTSSLDILKVGLNPAPKTSNIDILTVGRVAVENPRIHRGINSWTTIISPNATSFIRLPVFEAILYMGMPLVLLIGSLIFLNRSRKLAAKALIKTEKKLIVEEQERKRIEAVLLDTSTINQEVLNRVNCIVFTTDVNGIFQTFNSTAEELLGYKAEDVVEKFSPKIIHIEDEVSKYADELLKQGFELETEFDLISTKARKNNLDEKEWTYLHKDGSTFPIMLSISALRDNLDKLTGFLCIAENLSELKETRQQLRQSEERFQTFMNNSPAATFIKDADSKYLFVNETFEEKFSMRADELLGKTDTDWLPRTIAQKTRQAEQEIVLENKILTTTDIVPNPNGSTDYWHFVKFPIANPAGSSNIGGIGIEITELKYLEKELKAARDVALESVKLKSEFLANMSHEIRTPMSGVLGMTEILLKTDLNIDQRDYARTIETSAEALLTVLNNILDFSRIEAGKIAFETIDFELRNTLEGVVAMFSEEAEHKGLEIISVVETNTPTELRGDPGRLRQILVNLLGNAVKFTKRGSIYLKVSKVQESVSDTILQFEVVDTGIGIKPDVQRFMFHAFRQEDGSMSRNYQGTGLGLSISQQLVELLGGEIRLQSEPEKGSTVSFTVPFDKQPNGLKDEIKPLENMHGIRALIVESNSINREVLLHQISSWGINGTEAVDAKNAMDILDQSLADKKPFNIVFIDLLVPKADGFELARMIRRDKRYSDTKLILLPSFGKRGHAKDARDAGIDAYLVKPVKQSVLYDCVSTLLGHSSSTNLDSEKCLVTRHSLSEKHSFLESRILIAEDNLMNQKVTKNQVQRLGYEFDIVSNGVEVMEALGKQDYSLILMDCEMPEMDGYEATREIRRNEHGEQRIPIIAITANALSGEKEKCLNAGMDSYLAKPFKQKELKEAIEACLEKPETVRTIPISEISQTKNDDEYLSNVVFRLKELQNEVGDEMIDMIVSLFVEDSILRIKKMSELIENEDMSGVAKEAYTLKESTANIGADQLSGLFAELEASAKTASKSVVEDIFTKTKADFFNLLEAIEKLDLPERQHFN